jgi:methionine-rich copper-binding protein CopC
VTRFVRGAVVAALFLLLGAAPVFAHAELEESDPPDGAIITTPYTLTATFSEEFDPQRSFIRVEDVSGNVVAEGRADPTNATVMTATLPALHPGEYTVRWQTTTPDDNGVERGAFVFDVAEATTSRPPPTAAPASPAATRSGAAGQTPDGGNDTLLALAIAAAVLFGLGTYLLTRRR